MKKTLWVILEMWKTFTNTSYFISYEASNSLFLFGDFSIPNLSKTLICTYRLAVMFRLFLHTYVRRECLDLDLIWAELRLVKKLTLEISPGVVQVVFFGSVKAGNLSDFTGCTWLAKYAIQIHLWFVNLWVLKFICLKVLHKSLSNRFHSYLYRTPLGKCMYL